jgi:hypothetical protein
MVGYRHNVARYFVFLKEEWMALAVTSFVAGVVLGLLKPQSSNTFSLLSAVGGFILYFTAIFILLTAQVMAYKLSAIRFGLQVLYDKYSLGLLVGFFIGFLSFGYIPFFTTGRLYYLVIPNLRLGKFRATMAKHWEVGLTAAAGPMLTILLTIPLTMLRRLSGNGDQSILEVLLTPNAQLDIFGILILLCLLLTFLALLPLPLLETGNPYAVYMHRMEALEGNLPGFDILMASRSWFFFGAGLVVCFSLLALVFAPSVLVLLFSVLLGLGTMYLYTRFRYHFAA